MSLPARWPHYPAKALFILDTCPLFAAAAGSDSSCHMLPVFTATQCQQGPDVRHVLEPLEHGHQVQEIVVRRVADPPLDRDGVVYERPSISGLLSPTARRDRKEREAGGGTCLGGTCS